MTEIRGLMSGDKELGELKRDLARALAAVPKFTKRKLDSQYTEPMYLAFDHVPEGVWLLSCIDQQFQERPENVLTGGMVHWTYEGGKQRIRINSVDGLSPSNTRTFRFTFYVVG